MPFISIGPHCGSAILIKDNNVRIEAYPFDYAFSSLKLINDCILDNFNKLLDPAYLRRISATCSDNTYYNSYLDTADIRRHREKEGGTPVVFNHHNLTDESTRITFRRRCDRFMEAIKNKDALLIYTVYHYKKIENDYSDLIDFSQFINGINPDAIILVFNIIFYLENIVPSIVFHKDNLHIWQINGDDRTSDSRIVFSKYKHMENP